MPEPALPPLSLSHHHHLPPPPTTNSQHHFVAVDSIARAVLFAHCSPPPHAPSQSFSSSFSVGLHRCPPPPKRRALLLLLSRRRSLAAVSNPAALRLHTRIARGTPASSSVVASYHSSFNSLRPREKKTRPLPELQSGPARQKASIDQTPLGHCLPFFAFTLTVAFLPARERASPTLFLRKTFCSPFHFQTQRCDSSHQAPLYSPRRRPPLLVRLVASPCRRLLAVPCPPFFFSQQYVYSPNREAAPV